MNQLEADVVVIAAGAAGLPAAISAAQSGASVIAFEKGATTGGTANMGMGPFGVESRLQKLKQMGPTRDEAFKIFMDYTHWRVDARLVRTYIDKSATTIDWLEELGVEFLEPAAYFPGGAFTWHIVKPESGPPGPTAATAMMKTLTVKAKEIGVKILLQTPVEKIIKKEGKIVGVVAEDQSGEKIEVATKAVVIATGGFGNNPEMIKKYTGYEWGKDIFSFRVPGITGDGIRMAWEMGAAPSEMSMELTYGFPGGDLEPDIFMGFRQPHLLVNLLGQRFMDEGVMHNTTFTGNAIAVQKDKTAFLIFDEAIKTLMETKGFDSVGVVFPALKAQNIDAAIKNAFEKGYRELFVADSLDELASKAGIDPEGFKKTVEEYNGFCAKGHDDLFNKNYELLRPIKEPKFYAARLLPSGYGSLGGIKINEKTEVLDKKWNKIPGLYAAGTDACSIYGDSYVFVLPGNTMGTMGFALNSGRIAGENAAEYAKSTI
jgi:fumarate reductase flavoprotein subunit